MDDRFRSDFEKHRELSKRITFARTQISLPVANVRFSAEVSSSASGPDRRPSGVRARPVRLTSATLDPEVTPQHRPALPVPAQISGHDLTLSLARSGAGVRKDKATSPDAG